MKSLRVAVALFSLVAYSSPVLAVEPAARPSRVALPAAKTDGKVSVEKALKERRSLRAPSASPLTLEQVAQLAWAAQGVTDDKGHRTAPSAHATYPLDLYVLAGAVNGLAPGFYRYVPEGHALELIEPGDKRADFEAKGIGQPWVAKAPAIFVIAGTPEKMAKMKDRGVPFMWVEAGLAAQGFFLEATAMGLGSTYVGGFKPEARAALGLPATQEVLAVLPVGKKP